MAGATEASLGMLKEADLTDGVDRGALDKKLQGKRLAFVSPATPAKLCCLVVLAVLLENLLLLPLFWSAIKKKPVIKSSQFATCPKDWIGFRDKCFYFSEDTRNWTSSQSFCATLEANLVQLESSEELNFLKRYKGFSDHWIGLSRESSQEMWKWTNGTEYQAQFSIRGAGECAYLNDNGLSSARVYTERKWICSKPNSYVQGCQEASAS